MNKQIAFNYFKLYLNSKSFKEDIKGCGVPLKIWNNLTITDFSDVIENYNDGKVAELGLVFETQLEEKYSQFADFSIAIDIDPTTNELLNFTINT